MAVASRGKALSLFQKLIYDEPVAAENILADPYLPAGLAPSQDRVGMDPATLIGGYGREERYTAPRRQMRRRYATLLAPRPLYCQAAHRSTSPMWRRTRKTSLDLTMEGGTTSGVVYPLAICELATDFRFRNVGGASAGAIAAALTAAAELGRSSQVLASVDDEHPAHPAAELLTNGVRIRRGFTGIADIISWLAQTRPGDQQAEAIGRPSRSRVIKRLRSIGWPSSSGRAIRPRPSSGSPSRSCAAKAGHSRCWPSSRSDWPLACSRSP